MVYNNHKRQGKLNSTWEKIVQIQSGFEPMTPIAHMKNKKILEKRGFELQISGRESKTLPLDHCVIA